MRVPTDWGLGPRASLGVLPWLSRVLTSLRAEKSRGPSIFGHHTLRVPGTKSDPDLPSYLRRTSSDVNSTPVPFTQGPSFLQCTFPRFHSHEYRTNLSIVVVTGYDIIKWILVSRETPVSSNCKRTSTRRFIEFVVGGRRLDRRT